MIVTQKHIPRRTFLRGAGIAVGLPLLDAMVPALRAERTTAAAPVRRLGFVMYPMGVDQARWLPNSEGANYPLSEALQPLAPHKEKFIVLSGLSSSPDRTKADFHDRAIASFLTGCEPTAGKVQVGISVDQVAAAQLGKDTQFASLEMGILPVNSFGGICFKSATNPLPFETNPRSVFERLFGDSSRVDPAAASERDAADRSRLDTVVARITDLKRRLGAGDRRKLDEYLESIRDVERRIQVAMQKRPADLPQATRPAGSPESYADHVKLMFDLQAIALQADLTRVFTFMMATESCLLSYPEIGVTMQHHEVSHHNWEPEKLNALAKINLHQSELFAHFLSRMEAIKEPDGSLLDHSLIMYGSTLSNPTMHSQRNLPIILAGGAAGRVKGGRHLTHQGEPPLTNLYLSMLDKIGVPTEKLGDSTGKLNRLEV